MNVKLISEEITLSDADTVSNARRVRLYANGAESLITRRDSEGNILGSTTMPAGSIMAVEKESTDTLEASPSVKACSIAFSQ